MAWRGAVHSCPFTVVLCGGMELNLHSPECLHGMHRNNWLLKMEVKLNTHHWGIQWNSMVMQVKKVTFQIMGSGGKGRWDVSDTG